MRDPFLEQVLERRNFFLASLRAFCRVVVPIKPFTNTALYYKMLLESEPPPLLHNALGVLMAD